MLFEYVFCFDSKTLKSCCGYLVSMILLCLLLLQIFYIYSLPCYCHMFQNLLFIFRKTYKIPKSHKVFDSTQPTLTNFGFKKQVIHRGKAVNVDLPKFARPDTYNKVRCPNCPSCFKNNQGLGKHFQCLHSNDDSACSITSNFFAKSYKIADHKAKKDDCTFSNVKFVMDSVLRRVEGNISKYEAAKNKPKKVSFLYSSVQSRCYQQAHRWFFAR